VTENLHGVSSDVSDSVTVIASELAANCVRHAATDFRISIEQLPSQIRIEVHDAGGGQPVLRSPALTDESGRGLQIVKALSSDWGVDARADVPGKTVWAVVGT
jgi:anti-sigma regulatory factor (Ser/Thr protein kinase)